MHASVRYLCCGDAVQRVRGMDIHTTDSSYTSRSRYSTAQYIQHLHLTRHTIFSRESEYSNYVSLTAHTHTHRNIGGEIPTHSHSHGKKGREWGKWEKEGEGKEEKERRKTRGGGGDDDGNSTVLLLVRVLYCKLGW